MNVGKQEQKILVERSNSYVEQKQTTPCLKKTPNRQIIVQKQKNLEKLMTEQNLEVISGGPEG